MVTDAAVPPGAVLPGAVPPGAVLPGAVLPGGGLPDAVPPDAVPRDAVPPDAVLPGAVVVPAGGVVPGAVLASGAVAAPAGPVTAVAALGPSGEPIGVPVAVPGPLVPTAAPMGALLIAPPPARSTVGRAIVLGVAAAVIVSAAWVGGYLWFDRNQEVGRPVIAAQAAGPATTPTGVPESGPVDPTAPFDGLNPGGGQFDSGQLDGGQVDGGQLDDGQLDGQATNPDQTPAESLPSTPPTVPVDPVPVAGQASCEGPPGVDAAGVPQTYEVGRAYDGALDTAWRCAGDGAGQTVTFDLGQPVLLTSVGLVPGFDKIDPADGADRFAQGRTVVRARWVFDDGTSVEVTPDGVRGMQVAPVQVTTQSVQLQILETRPGSVITDNAGVQWAAVDATAVSEVQFSGLTY